MNKVNVIFESILIGITIIIGFYSIIEYARSDTFAVIVVYSFIWWGIFGFLQLIHSFYLASIFWKNADIRSTLTNYFWGVGIDILLLFIAFFYDPGDFFGIVAVFLLPGTLAIYLWYIAYNFREKDSPELSSEENTAGSL